MFSDIVKQKLLNIYTYGREWLKQHPKKAAFALAIVALLLIAGRAMAQTAPTVTLNVSPTSGTGSVVPVLTWSSTNATSCVASGAWSGNKAVSGTETLPAIAASATYTLTCFSGSGAVTASWTPPTTNTDGSALTNLTGYKVYHATTSAGVATGTVVSITAPASSYTITGLPAGDRYVAVKAVNSNGAESALSNIAMKTVVTVSAAASVSVVINKIPNPPTNLVVVSAIAMDVRWRNSSMSYALNKEVGTVPTGTACVQDFVIDGNWYRVPYDSVKFTRKPASAVIVAQCSMV